MKSLLTHGLGTRNALARRALPLGVVGSLIVTAGVAGWVEANDGSRPEARRIEAARLETDALRADLLDLAREEGDWVPGTCDLHHQLASFVEKYERRGLLEGSFAEMVGRSVSANRARRFVDPWDSPYWIWKTCGPDGSRSVVLVYSFGPNGLRDTNRAEIRGDDVGAILASSGF